MVSLFGFVIACVGLLGIVNCQNIVDVTKFGAVGDGKTDDSKAFLKAWKEACGKSGFWVLQIPRGKSFFLQPVVFKGPCKSSINIELEGTLVIPNPNEWKSSQNHTWLLFKNIEGLSLLGSGKINGRGEPWWQAGKDSTRPSSLAFSGCKNLDVNQITSINTPRSHISIAGCNNTLVTYVNLIAPEKSPNTDGIDISHSSQVNIQDSFIGTGDDCVAINGGCIGVNITNVTCGPGHGLSVGSLGHNAERDTVEHVQVKNCTFNRTQNGARVKTWPGGSGYAKNILFEDIILIEAGNPIMIDQHYGHCEPNCPGGRSVVEVSDVKFKRFNGTSGVKNAITLNCSDVKGCNDIVLEDVNIKPGPKAKKLQVVCENVHGTSRNTVPHLPCLSG